MEGRILQNQTEILQSLNLEQLVPHLCKHGVVELQEVGALVCNRTLTREKRNRQLLAILDTKEPSVFNQFLQCLDEETDHMGHAYISCLLRGRSFGDKETVELSNRLSKNINGCMPDIMKGINIHSLTAYLRRDALLTNTELESLTSHTKTRTEKIYYLLDILSTKGPIAHYKFVCCLGEEDEHCTHQELFKKITTEEKSEVFRLQRKRKSEGGVNSVTKRVPDRIKAQGSLVSDEYFECISKLRQFNMSGDWKEAEELVQDVKRHRRHDTAFQIAVMLESCSAYITLRDKDRALLEIGRAMEKCESLLFSSSDNWSFLRGRCDWMLAKLYRYTKEMDKALSCIQKATELQSNIASGEDAALTNYCYGSILLECLSKPDKYSCTPEDKKKAENYLERAIFYASQREEYGLDLAHPRIRLAQLYLGSSPFKPGEVNDPESISRAGSSLKAVENFDALQPRTKCIFYFTKSDLVYSSSREEARHYAQLALDIAKESEFKTEVMSAQARLERLDHASSEPRLENITKLQIRAVQANI